MLGLDPEARLAAFARGTGVDVEVATLEEWQPAGRSFDAVVAGESWHWIDPVAGAARAAAVLPPAAGIRSAGAFEEPAERRIEWEQRYTRDEWLDALQTTGVPAGELLAALLAGVGAVIDRAGGGFTMRYYVGGERVRFRGARSW